MKNPSISFIFQRHRPIWNPGHSRLYSTNTFSLTFRFSCLLPHGIFQLSPFLRSCFIQREGMVSIIYSIPTHLWPWLMHHNPSSSLCQACHRIQYVHTHTQTHEHTHAHTEVTGCRRAHISIADPSQPLPWTPGNKNALLSLSTGAKPLLSLNDSTFCEAGL